MKKILSLSLFIILCFSMVACGSRVSEDDVKRATKHLESHGYEDTFEYRRSMKMNCYNYDIATFYSQKYNTEFDVIIGNGGDWEGELACQYIGLEMRDKAEKYYTELFQGSTDKEYVLKYFVPGFSDVSSGENCHEMITNWAYYNENPDVKIEYFSDEMPGLSKEFRPNMFYDNVFVFVSHEQFSKEEKASILQLIKDSWDDGEAYFITAEDFDFKNLDIDDYVKLKDELYNLAETDGVQLECIFSTYNYKRHLENLTTQNNA